MIGTMVNIKKGVMNEKKTTPENTAYVKQVLVYKSKKSTMLSQQLELGKSTYRIVWKDMKLVPFNI